MNLSRSNAHLIALSLFIVIASCAAHVGFLSSDAPETLSFSRGPLTDEGLYTSQIRHYIETGNLDFKESGALLKTPVFSAYLSPFFILGGTEKELARFAVSLFVVISLLIILWLSRESMFVLGLFFILFFEYHIFHFSHLAMAEITVLCSALISIVGFAHYLNEPKTSRKSLFVLICSTLALSFSWLLKIQYIYLLALAPILTGSAFLFRKYPFSVPPKHVLVVAFGLILPIVAFYFIWYSPNKAFFDYIMIDQQSSRLVFIAEDLWNWVEHNNKLHFSEGLLFYLKWASAASILLFSVLWLRRGMQSILSWIAFASAIWFILELHKMSLQYLPERYILTLIAASCCFVIATLCWALHRTKLYTPLIGCLICLSAMIQFPRLIESYQKRTYYQDRIEQYLEKSDKSAALAMGGWAASFNWGTTTKTLPIWRNYLYDKSVLNLKPDYIISEIDESDSQQAFALEQVSLIESADSVRHFKYHDYNLLVYWFSYRPQEVKE